MKQQQPTEIQSKNYFPQGLALDENFCNRTHHKQELLANLQACRPTLIMSPRRYGKTSLVLEVLQRAEYPFARVDLFSELTEKDIQNSILSGIGSILYQLESIPKKALNFITEFFSQLDVNFGFSGKKIEIHFSKTELSPAKMILNALKKLDLILKQKKKSAVLFIDEFQRIAQISDSATIEGAIRQLAQESRNIVFLFSGSHRHLLENMFDDKTKPLYKLCDRMTLDRITITEYIPFIQKKFEEKTKESIPKEYVELILELTECHPYYVNVLCHKVSSIQHKITEQDVITTWRYYADAERSHVLREMDLLSTNQSKMLIALAKFGDTYLPMSKEFLSEAGFSVSSAIQSIKVLLKKDYILPDPARKYKIIDPLLNYLFKI